MSKYIKHIEINKNGSTQKYNLGDPSIKEEISIIKSDIDKLDTQLNGKYNVNGYDYVDLGLPSGTLWATTNIGASKPEEPGLYFAYGEILGYNSEQIGIVKQFTWDDYKFGTRDNLTKYNNDDQLINLELEDDAAHVYMGGNWEIPTKEQLQELLDNTNRSYISTPNGATVIACRYISKINGNSITIGDKQNVAQNGNIYDGIGSSYGHNAYIRTKTLKDSNNAYTLGSYMGNLYMTNWERYIGIPIRGVISKTEKYLTRKESDEINNKIDNKIDNLVDKDSKLEEKIDIVENVLFNKGEVGDVVLVNNKTLEKITVKSDELEKYKKTHTPIGVLVIPVSHDVYGTGEAGVMSLLFASLTTPDEGDPYYAHMMLGQQGRDTDLPNYSGVTTLGNYDVWDPVSIFNGNTGSYLPSDQPSFNKVVNPDPNSDQEVTGYYYKDSYQHAPSPYKANGAFNEDYSFQDDKGVLNALSDFNGKSNTEVLISLATKQADWKTATSITDDKGAGYSPAACACWRFHTFGTSQGDWYLPAMGELGYCCVRFTKINNTLSEIARVFNIFASQLVTVRPFSSSSEGSSTNAWNVYFSTGSVGNGGKNYDCCVRPFTRIKIENNRLDNTIKKVEELNTKLEELDSAINSSVTPEEGQIIYTTTDSKKINIIDSGRNADGNNFSGIVNTIESHEYFPAKGYGIITLKDKTKVTDNLLQNQPTLKSVIVSGSFKVIDQYAFMNLILLQK